MLPAVGTARYLKKRHGSLSDRDLAFWGQVIAEATHSAQARGRLLRTIVRVIWGRTMRVGTLCLMCVAVMVNLAFPAQVLPQDRVERLLGELSNASGPSGFEGSVRVILEREMRA